MEHAKVQLGTYIDPYADKVPFGISYADRFRHLHVIGQTGTGKSTLGKQLAIADMNNGEGLCFIDPHGTEAEELVNRIPRHRLDDVVYFNAADTEYPVGLNLFEHRKPDERDRLTSEIVGTFKYRWADTWGQRMEYIFKNTVRALLDHPTTRHGSTLLAVQRMFEDDGFRGNVLKHVTNQSVRNFWEKEFATYTKRDKSDRLSPIQNKVGMFGFDLLRNMVGQPKSTIDVEHVMNNRQILIVNLAKGEIGDDNANLIGSMLATKIALAAMHRSRIPEDARVPFHLIIDEFQRVATTAFISVLSEARKFKLSLTLMHQYLEQMDEVDKHLAAAVFGNCGSFIAFRVGADDANRLARHLDVSPNVLPDMSNFEVAAKLTEGAAPVTFRGTTLPIPPYRKRETGDYIVRRSHARFAKPRRDVEKAIRRWERHRYAIVRPKRVRRKKRSPTATFVQV